MHKQLKIKSNITKYQINFDINFYEIIKNYNEHEVLFLVDKNIIKNYKKISSKIKKKIIIPFNSSEKSKEYSFVSSIIEKLLNKGIKKNSLLVVIGGGISQDIGGFISSILFRGIKWHFFPTTLLSQGDSCIGSKTSINFKKYKNQIGTFNPPSQIYVDYNFLKSLNRNDLFSGIGEMSHYLIIGGKQKFKILQNQLNKKKINYSMLILESLKIKKKYIELDEFDNNIRNILNYGHTFGHAIESATNYKVPHGIAVAIGIDISNFFSFKYNLMKNKERISIQKTLYKIFHIIDFKSINIDKVLNAIKNDKKATKDFVNLILCIRLGKIIIRKVKIDNNFKLILSEYFKDLPC